jgi:hypothetical protein
LVKEKSDVDERELERGEREEDKDKDLHVRTAALWCKERA